MSHFSQINQWLQQLNNIRQENAMIKFTLSELVDRSVMTDFLSKAEKIQNELLQNDESIALLYDSATHIQSKLNTNDPEVVAHYLRMKKQLETDLKTFKNRFTLLKKRFSEEMMNSSGTLL